MEEENMKLDTSDEAFTKWLESQRLSNIDDDLKQILHEQWLKHRTNENNKN